MCRTSLCILLLLGSLGLFTDCHHDRDKHGEPEKIALHLPDGTPKRPQGMAALTVKSGAAEPFTKQDVVTYFQTHNLPKNSGQLGQFKVDTLEFVTSKDVSQRLQGVSTGLDDTARVGFVTLTGTFIFTGPPSIDAKRELATFNRAYAVFDTSTGNLLMVGTLEAIDRPR
jgi:hypothetical protein